MCYSAWINRKKAGVRKTPALAWKISIEKGFIPQERLKVIRGHTLKE